MTLSEGFPYGILEPNRKGISPSPRTQPRYGRRSAAVRLRAAGSDRVHRLSLALRGRRRSAVPTLNAVQGFNARILRCFRSPARMPQWPPRHELLHPVVPRVSHVQVPLRIQRQRPGIEKLARAGPGPPENLDRPSVGSEHLDAAIAELADILAAVPGDTDVVGIIQLTGPLTCRAVSAQKLAA